jgi:hypothetical protein
MPREMLRSARIQFSAAVKPDDVPHLFDEERVGGQLNALGAVRLDPNRAK